VVFFSQHTLSDNKAPAFFYQFASIEHLVEQEVGEIILPKIYKNIGINIFITPLPGKRAQFVANNGYHAGEIMRIWTYGLENVNTVRVPTPYYYLETMPFILKKSNIVIKHKKDLSKYRLSKIRGVKHTNNITKGMHDIYEMSNSKEMFKLLVSGKVDVVLTNTLDGNLTLKELGYADIITPMKSPLAVLPLYHYIHKKHVELVPLIDKEIKRLKNSGVLATMIIKAEKEVIDKHKLTSL
jgi:ABC-type amino acid transport substrate-binding protein